MAINYVQHGQIFLRYNIKNIVTSPKCIMYRWETVEPNMLLRYGMKLNIIYISVKIDNFKAYTPL